MVMGFLNDVLLEFAYFCAIDCISYPLVVEQQPFNSLFGSVLDPS